MATYTWLPDAFIPPPHQPEPVYDKNGKEITPPRAPIPARPVFTAFDLETTGLEKTRDRIVEIGAVKFDAMGVIARFNVLINPGIPMPPEAGRVNGISDEMLADKPPIEEVMGDFVDFVGDSILIAHNAPFDTGFVNEALSILHRQVAEDPSQMSLLGGSGADDAPGGTGGDNADGTDGAVTGGRERKRRWRAPWPALPNRIVDTRILAKESFPNRPNYKLQDLASWLGIEAIAAHRAEDDARVCMDLFVKCVEAIKSRRGTP